MNAYLGLKKLSPNAQDLESPCRITLDELTLDELPAHVRNFGTAAV